MTATLASRDRELAALKARSSSAAAADTAAELARLRQERDALATENATLRQQLTASQKELAATKLALTGNGRVPAATDDLSRQLAGAAGKPDVSSATNLVQVNAAQTVTATPAGATEKLDPALTPDNVQLASTRSDTPAAANATATQPLKTRR
jgi:poly-gamma-glutamate capsule biosynthesis protein CapA/YwtB (metallophosphatase superfamily)